MPYNKTNNNETIQTTVRIQKSIYEKIIEYADKDSRDVSKQINHMLKAFIEIKEK